MKILLLGRDGQVGWELQRSLAPLGTLFALNRADERGLSGDLGQLDSLAETVRAVQPDVIVNAAAYTAVDKAESEPEKARLINAEAPDVLAHEAKRCGAWLVHYSTDYVFDGSGDRPWRETDQPGPLNVYGKTKLQGEEVIRESGCNHLIFRTSWVYAARGNNFIRTMLRLARDRDSLKVIDDQHGAPTGAELIADVTAHALSRVSMSAAEPGIYHLAPSGETTWNGYARFVVDCARTLGWSIRVSADCVEAVPTETYPTPAKRPRNSRLECGRISQEFGVHLPDWRSGVERIVRELSTGN